MSLEGSGRSAEKSRHPVLMAIAVVAIILLAATAYTFAGAQAGVDERSQQAASTTQPPAIGAQAGTR